MAAKMTKAKHCKKNKENIRLVFQPSNGNCHQRSLMNFPPRTQPFPSHFLRGNPQKPHNFHPKRRRWCCRLVVDVLRCFSVPCPFFLWHMYPPYIVRPYGWLLTMNLFMMKCVCFPELGLLCCEFLPTIVTNKWCFRHALLFILMVFWYCISDVIFAHWHSRCMYSHSFWKSYSWCCCHINPLWTTPPPTRCSLFR